MAQNILDAAITESDRQSIGPKGIKSITVKVGEACEQPDMLQFYIKVLSSKVCSTTVDVERVESLEELVAVTLDVIESKT